MYVFVYACGAPVDYIGDLGHTETSVPEPVDNISLSLFDKVFRLKTII